MVSHQALISFQVLWAQTATFHTGALHLHSRSLADTPDLTQHQFIIAFRGCRLVQCRVTQPETNQNTTGFPHVTHLRYKQRQWAE